MTTEPTQPASEAGLPQTSASGQLQGHRRRRRRRKTKSTQAQQGQPNAANSPDATPAPVAAAEFTPVQGPPPVQHSGVGAQNSRPNTGQGTGQGRKKKRSRAKDQQPAAPQPPLGNNINAGNGSNGGGQGKKRTKQKGPRQFVGPMDHSYRVANGNIADGPPSTIPFQANGHGEYYNDPPPPRGAIAPTIPANAHTRIFFFIEDLFFLAKIQEASRKLGVKVEFVKGDKEVLDRITGAPEDERAALLVFDLNNAAVKPLTIIPKLKTKLKKSVSIIGFLSHLQGDLKMKALEAGCDTVMPRSAFSQSLPNLLRRYGMEEEEDNYPQPAF